MIDQDMITRRLSTYMKETNRRLDHLELLETPRVEHEDSVLLNQIMLFPATGGDVQFFPCTQAGVVAVLAAVVPGSGDLIVGNFAVSIPLLIGITIPATTRVRHLNMRFTCGGSAVTLSNYDELEHCSIVQDGTGFATAYALDAYVAGAGVRDVKITNTYATAMSATSNIGGILKGVAQEHGPEAKSSWFQAFGGAEAYSLYMLQDSFAESCYAGGNMASAHNIGVVFDSAQSDQFRAGRFINGWITVGLGGGGSVAWGVNVSNNHYGTLIGTYVWGATIGVNLPAGNTLYVRNDTWNSISSLGTLTRLPGDGLSSYIWFDVKDYGAVGNGIANDTAAVAACLAALVAAGGGVLYFPHGRYLTSGNFTLTVPTTVIGDGSPSYFDDTIANTVIICNSSTNSLFTVAAVGCDFKDFFALNTHAAPIAGAGITVASNGDQMHFDNLTIRAFYTCLDIQDGAQWKVNGCYLVEPVKYGLHAQHTDFSGDFGDWSIDNTEVLSGARDADAAIYIQSGGGGKISNTKINGWYVSPPAGHAFLYGIYLGIGAGVTTGNLLVSNCSIENILHDGICVATSGGTWDYIVIVGNQFGMYGSDASAINIAAANVGDIHGVVLDGLVMVNNGSSAQAAIRLTKVDTVTVGTISNYGFTSDVNPTNCTNYYRTLSPVPATAANQVLISGASPFLPVWSTWFLTGTAGQTYTLGTTGGTIPTSAGTLSVSSANAVSVAGVITHAITSSSNPGAAASLLASDASGYLELVGLGVGALPTSTYKFKLVGSVAGYTGVRAHYENTIADGDPGFVGFDVQSGSRTMRFGIYRNGAGTSAIGQIVVDVGEFAFASDAASQGAFFVCGYGGTHNRTVFGAYINPTAQVQIESLTTTTNAVTENLRLESRVSTAATGSAAGFGAGMTWYAESATDGNYRQQGAIYSSWADATDATRKANLIFTVYDTAVRTALILTATGSAPTLVFGGHSYAQADSRKVYWGAGDDLSIYYDGTNGYIKADEVAASDLHLTAGAAKTLVLDTPVYNDANVGSLVLVTGGTLPGVVEILESDGGASGIYTRGFAVGEQGSGAIEFPHSYKEGTDIVFHVHWVGQDAPSGTDNVKWRLTYSVTRDGVVTPAATTIVDAADTAINTQYMWAKTDVATITGTNFKIGDQFNFTLTRIAATGDAYAGEALVATLGFHYQCDTIGSRQISTK